jgi:hypothetical protein
VAVAGLLYRFGGREGSSDAESERA